jgi:hypothetical protein
MRYPIGCAQISNHYDSTVTIPIGRPPILQACLYIGSRCLANDIVHQFTKSPLIPYTKVRKLLPFGDMLQKRVAISYHFVKCLAAHQNHARIPRC